MAASFSASAFFAASALASSAFLAASFSASAFFAASALATSACLAASASASAFFLSEPKNCCTDAITRGVAIASVAARVISPDTEAVATTGVPKFSVMGPDTAAGAAGFAADALSEARRCGSLPLGRSPAVTPGARLALPTARSISPRYLRASGLPASMDNAVSNCERADA